MRFALLGSGSKGNATLVQEGNTHLLVDSGFSVREVEQRLQRLGCEADQLSAILVTHEHNDHIGGVGPLARKYRIPVWMTPGTWSRSKKKLGDVPHLSLFNCHQDFAIDGVQVHPFPVPHDAREPCQFILSDGAQRLGILTDTGHITPHIETQLSGCDALILECNHDVEMLATGSYPHSLKQRVGGGLGHLSNEQAAQTVSRLNTDRLQHMVGAHLSENNNAPELARQALARGLGCEEEWIALAEQSLGLDWREIA